MTDGIALQLVAADLDEPMNVVVVSVSDSSEAHQYYALGSRLSLVVGKDSVAGSVERRPTFQ